MTSNPQVELVMWDFGGVFTPSPFHGTEDYATQLGTTSEKLADVVLGYDQPDGDHPWHRLERGELSMADAAAQVTERAAAAGIQGFSVAAFFQSMGGLDGGGSREAMLAVVGRVNAVGIANVIVTNNIAELGERWRTFIPDGLFDHIVDSSEVGVRKPDPAIFRLALDKIGVAAEAVVFLDDHSAHVDAASAMGIDAILVGAEPLVAADQLLAKLGI